MSSKLDRDKMMNEQQTTGLSLIRYKSLAQI